jgi:hypothetical protein
MAIKGWKHAHSDLAKIRQNQANQSKGVKLVSVKKDGTESKMHDVTKHFNSEQEALDHHQYIRKLNPARNVRHNLYVDGQHKGMLAEDTELEFIESLIDEGLSDREIKDILINELAGVIKPRNTFIRRGFGKPKVGKIIGQNNIINNNKSFQRSGVDANRTNKRIIRTTFGESTGPIRAVKDRNTGKWHMGKGKRDKSLYGYPAIMGGTLGAISHFANEPGKAGIAMGVGAGAAAALHLYRKYRGKMNE